MDAIVTQKMEGGLGGQISRVVLEDTTPAHTLPSNLSLKLMHEAKHHRVTWQFGNILASDEVQVLHLAFVEELFEEGLHDAVDGHCGTGRIAEGFSLG
jgi:hypothetical protein